MLPLCHHVNQLRHSVIAHDCTSKFSSSTEIHVPQLTQDQFSVASSSSHHVWPECLWKFGFARKNPSKWFILLFPQKNDIFGAPFCREESAPGNWPRPQSRVAPEEVPGEQVPPKNHGEKPMEKSWKKINWVGFGSWLVLATNHDFVTTFFLSFQYRGVRICQIQTTSGDFLMVIKNLTSPSPSRRVGVPILITRIWFFFWGGTHWLNPPWFINKRPIYADSTIFDCALHTDLLYKHVLCIFVSCVSFTSADPSGCTSPFRSNHVLHIKTVFKFNPLVRINGYSA